MGKSQPNYTREGTTASSTDESQLSSTIELTHDRSSFARSLPYQYYYPSTCFKEENTGRALQVTETIPVELVMHEVRTYA
jgi:hypothetical protein